MLRPRSILAAFLSTASIILMLMIFWLISVVFFGLQPFGLMQAFAAPIQVDWQTSRNRDHPLVGRIFSTRDRRELTPGELIDALAGERFVLLGEIHDNPDHHKLQAFIIAELAKRGRRPTVVMEQINADQFGMLKLFMSGKYRTAARLGPAIEWQKQGWPAWPNYQPIAESAFAADLPLVGGDSSKSMNRKIGKQGFKALPEKEVRELGLHLPLGKRLQKALMQDLVESHCNMMPASRMGPMARVQRYRDAHLARAMRKADTQDGAVLIAGNGHIRRDRAVPWYLRGENIASLSLMIVEAHKDAKTYEDMIPAAHNGRPQTDFVWVTPGAERKDPCASLKKRFKGKKPPKHGK